MKAAKEGNTDSVELAAQARGAERNHDETEKGLISTLSLSAFLDYMLMWVPEGILSASAGDTCFLLQDAKKIIIIMGRNGKNYIYRACIYINIYRDTDSYIEREVSIDLSI